MDEISSLECTTTIYKKCDLLVTDAHFSVLNYQQSSTEFLKHIAKGNNKNKNKCLNFTSIKMYKL